MKLSEVLKSRGLTCAIPYADVSKMLKMISESRVDDKERAITFCADKGLSFPQAEGWPFAIAPEECPPGKETLGDFHTHIPREEKVQDPPEESVYDLEDDIRKRRNISCVGGPQLVIGPEGVIQHRTIVCHTFNREHPEYEDFRQRFLPVVSEAGNYFDMLEMETELEDREPTDEECAKWRDYDDKFRALIEEAKSKGIIKSCAPLFPLSVPDVEGHLAEQRRP